LDVANLAPGQTRALEHAGIEILLCNVGGELHAVENRCTHAAVPLTEAFLSGCELECPVHGALFDVRDGRALALPAREPLRSFPVTRMGDEAEIHL
jgi:3-phenylpropionate/trans-cinnamate dioxygenase ferredoxin subunit